jgi:hypothetical protein
MVVEGILAKPIGILKISRRRISRWNFLLDFSKRLFRNKSHRELRGPLMPFHQFSYSIQKGGFYA